MNLFVLRALNFSRRWKDELFPLLSFFSAQFVHSLHRCCFSPSFDFFSLLHCLLVFTTWLEPPVGVRDFHRVNFLSLCCYFVALFHRSFESSCVRLAEKCIKTATSTPSLSLCRRVESESLRPKNVYMNAAERILLIVKKRNRHIRKKRRATNGVDGEINSSEAKEICDFRGSDNESWANRQCYYIKLTTKHIYVARENIMLMLRRFSLQRMKQKLSVKNNKFIDFFAVWRSCCVRLSAFRRLSHMRNMLWNLYGELCVQMAFELALYWSVRMAGLIGESGVRDLCLIFTHNTTQVIQCLWMAENKHVICWEVSSTTLNRILKNIAGWMTM